jgi:hypothetical protein
VKLTVVVVANSEPDTITVVTEDLAAAVLPPPRPAGPFTGDASLLTGKYKGPGRGRDLVIDVTQTPQGIAFSVMAPRRIRCRGSRVGRSAETTRFSSSAGARIVVRPQNCDSTRAVATSS